MERNWTTCHDQIIMIKLWQLRFPSCYQTRSIPVLTRLIKLERFGQKHSSANNTLNVARNKRQGTEGCDDTQLYSALVRKTRKATQKIKAENSER